MKSFFFFSRLQRQPTNWPPVWHSDPGTPLLLQKSTTDLTPTLLIGKIKLSHLQSSIRLNSLPMLKGLSLLRSHSVLTKALSSGGEVMKKATMVVFLLCVPSSPRQILKCNNGFDRLSQSSCTLPFHIRWLMNGQCQLSPCSTVRSITTKQSALLSRWPKSAVIIEMQGPHDSRVHTCFGLDSSKTDSPLR